jgi:hypothetical protein
MLGCGARYLTGKVFNSVLGRKGKCCMLVHVLYTESSRVENLAQVSSCQLKFICGEVVHKSPPKYCQSDCILMGKAVSIRSEPIRG